MCHRRVLSAATVAVAALLAAAPARATVTTTHVDSPADGAHVLLTDAQPAVAVSGTSDGRAGDGIDVRCTDRVDGPFVLGTASGPAWKVPATRFVSGGDAYVGHCALHAIPLAGTGDLGPFPAARVIVERSTTRRAAGAPVDFDDGIVRDLASAQISSAGATGLADWRPYDPATGVTGAPGLLAGGVLDGTLAASDIDVDGLRGYLPATLLALSPGARGVPAITHAISDDRRTVTESEPVLVCADPVCTLAADSGVRLDRTTTLAADGRTITQRTTFASTDDTPHRVGFALAVTVPGARPEFALSWDGAGYAPRPPAAPVAGPPGAGSLLARDGAAAEGDPAAPHVAVTFARAPDALTFPTGAEASLAYDAAATPTSATLIYALRATSDDTAAAAATDEDAAIPPTLAITSPRDDASVYTARVTVAGTASDNRGVASVTVAGTPATLGPDGRWEATVPVAPGRRTLTVVAADAAGATATARVRVRYRDIIAPLLRDLHVSRAGGRIVVRARTGEKGRARLTLLRGNRRVRSLTHTVRAGAFTIRLAARGLRPATYTAALTVVDAAGNASRTRRARFRVR